jgi:uncharacterized protein YabE (DUF348 family)
VAHPNPVPGHIDVWNHVSFVRSLRSTLSRPSSRPTGPALRIGALATALVLATGASVATAAAHKSVTLDVDGQTTEVTTFSGSIAGLLADQGIVLGEHDVVVPASAEALREGDEVVIRHGHALQVQLGDERTTVWTTALSAQDALADMGARGDNVSLLPSRSMATGRADLSLDLDLDGPVAVVADGTTHEVVDGSVGLSELLTDLGITLGELDRIHVQLLEPTDAANAGDAAGSSAEQRLTVVVQRVVAEEQTTVSELPFESVTEQTDQLYKGQTTTAVAGVAGERTVVERVVLVDGVEESRLVVSDGVTRAPVTEVVRQGTKARPAPAPAAAPRTAATSGGRTYVVSGDVWGALARCESGGNPTAVSSNGLYYGLYQFSLGTWQAMGGSGLPSQASPAEQTQRAQALQARSGWGQWPACAAKLGLL